MTLGAMGPGGRQRAKEILCQSNLRQWGIIFENYVGDYGKYPGGSHPDGFSHYDPDGQEIWINALAGYYPKDDYKLLCCPVAAVPAVDSNGQLTGVQQPYAAWGRLPNAEWFIEDMYGSYGMNWYCYNPTREINRIHRWYTRDFWGHPDYKNASEIPLFFDSSWISVGPFHTDRPPEYPGEMPDIWPADEMKRVCLDRHDGAINMLFMDSSVRKVGLKQLWRLKWHKRFDTDYDRLYFDRAEWMQDLKDY
jgi:prepilin-type processing-associated H-X9-DG protein